MNSYDDIEIILQDDGPNPVVPIAYPPEYETLMNIFRGLQNINEYSLRALELMNEIIEYNPANYSIWKYRLDTVLNINYDLKLELIWIEELTIENPKSYQIWHYRQNIIEKLQDPSNEILFINRQLENDAKNYHGWSYRQWLVSTFKIYENELNDMDRFLELDVLNNSAWNHRYFLLNFLPEIKTQEIEYTMKKILIYPENESAWNYLKAVFEKDPDKDLRSLILEFINAFDEKPIYGLMLEYNLKRESAILQELIHKDPIRQNYYKNLIRKTTEK